MKTPRSCFAGNILRTRGGRTVSGKIEAGESALECIRRGVTEEGVWMLPERLRHAGVATWNAGADPTRESRGMRVFIAESTGDAGATEGENPGGTSLATVSFAGA